MNQTLAPPWPYAPALFGDVGSNVRRWLRNILYLHLDFWPWEPVPDGTHQALTLGGMGGRSPEDPADDGDEAETENGFAHQPVMLREARDFLKPAPGKLFLDATLGGGGHAATLLAAGADVLGLDQDEEAIACATKRLRKHAEHFVALRLNFRAFGQVLDEAGVDAVDGIIADIGLSSHQLDTAERGFSFQQDGPLDMRMDARGARTAADIVNQASAQELARIFHEYGEEPFARRAAAAIVKRRALRPFHRTLDLAETLAAVLPRRGGKHPATRVFQALRIELNQELEALREFLEQAPRHLKPGGRIVVISFHSLEDRIAKQTLARFSTEWIDRPEWPEPRRNPEYCMRLLTKKPVEPSPDEIARNPRARSARLRVAERLPE